MQTDRQTMKITEGILVLVDWCRKESAQTDWESAGKGRRCQSWSDAWFYIHIPYQIWVKILNLQTNIHAKYSLSLLQELLWAMPQLSLVIVTLRIQSRLSIPRSSHFYSLSQWWWKRAPWPEDRVLQKRTKERKNLFFSFFFSILGPLLWSPIELVQVQPTALLRPS